MTEFTREEIEKAIGVKAEGNLTEKFSGLSTDTRKIGNGSLFIALKGEKFNGEDFVSDAIEKGASGVVTSKDFSGKVNAAIFKVEDTLKAYQQIAHFWREKFNAPVIAITGSNGKTTTKELVAAALSPLGEIHKTAANFNNEVGLPLTLLGIRENHKAVVVEIGMRGLKQIEALAPVANPSIGVVTNVGETHIELLGSVENIAKAKSELVEAIQEGTVILNRDDPNVYAMKDKAKPNVKVITFGIYQDADVKASEISYDGLITTFNVSYKGKNHAFALPLAGEHNVYNALAAISAGISLNITLEDMSEALKTVKNVKMRFEITEKDGITFINDAYNASPLSMKASISTTAGTYKGRKIAVLGDMLELGNEEYEAHIKVGKDVKEFGFYALITLGERGKIIAEGAKTAGLTECFSANTHEEAANTLKTIMKKEDTVLLKGSRGMEMEKILGYL